MKKEDPSIKFGASLIVSIIATGAAWAIWVFTNIPSQADMREVKESITKIEAVHKGDMDTVNGYFQTISGSLGEIKGELKTMNRRKDR